jgi:hypothetical protein
MIFDKAAKTIKRGKDFVCVCVCVCVCNIGA